MCHPTLIKVRSCNSNHDAMHGEPDFRLITRSGSISSRKSISALDVGVDDDDNHSGGDRAAPSEEKGPG